MQWAAAGMARVAATLKNSKYASQYSTEIKNLNNWAMEIVKATSSAMDVSRSSQLQKDGKTRLVVERQKAHACILLDSVLLLASLAFCPINTRPAPLSEMLRPQP